MKNIILALALLFICLNAIGEQSAHLDKHTFSAKQQEQMTLKAEKLLDEWGGSPEQLDQASDLLTKVLKANPRHLEAHFELARYFIKSGHINYRNYQPGSLEKATQELELALQYKPSWGKAYVLLGNIKYLRNDLISAIELFKKAEALGTDYKWLYIDWGNTLVALNDLKGAEIQLNKVRTRKDLSNKELSGLNEALIEVYSRQGRAAEANQVYKDDIALYPSSAWKHGNYADFLLLGLGLPDESIAEANKALQLMDYGAGHYVLGRAQYAKWAQLKDKSPAEANEYFRRAQENAPDLAWVFPLLGNSVDVGPVLQNLVIAFMGIGVPIDLPDAKGDTAFTLASSTGKVNAMTWLAKHGANINIMPPSISSPLIYAINKQDLFTINALIALKVDVNLKTEKGYTPLMQAASIGNLTIVKVLVEAGADWSARYGTTDYIAENFAASGGHNDVLVYLYRLNKARK